MGLPAKADISIVYEENAPSIYNSIEELMKALINVKLGDYSINDLKVVNGPNDSIVSFELSSVRSQNLTWQIDRLRDLLRERKEVIVEFCSSAWQMMDDESTYLEGEDIKKYL